MAKASPAPSAPPKERKRGVFSLILSPIGIAVGIVSYLVISILVSTAIEWVGMGLGYWDSNHARNVLVQEFEYLGDNFSTTIFGVSAREAGEIVIGYLQHWLVGSGTGGDNGMIVMRYIQKLGNWTQPYINAFIYIVMVTGIRCVIIVLSSALFLIVGIAAAVDGLHMRELRKDGGGVEHASIYHHAKAWVPLAVMTAPVIYLAWPGSINPNYVLLPAMGIFYIALLTTFSTFKKHL